jgi:hypothetical protein
MDVINTAPVKRMSSRVYVYVTSYYLIWLIENNGLRKSTPIAHKNGETL